MFIITVLFRLDGDDAEAVVDSNNLDEDVAEPLTEKESEIRSYLVHGEQLQEETLEELISPFWNQEPYKYGFMDVYQ